MPEHEYAHWVKEYSQQKKTNQALKLISEDFSKATAEMSKTLEAVHQAGWNAIDPSGAKRRAWQHVHGRPAENPMQLLLGTALGGDPQLQSGVLTIDLAEKRSRAALVPTIVARNLNRLRLEAKLSYRRLAKHVGSQDHKAVMAHCKGTRDPEDCTIAEYAQALERELGRTVTLEDLKTE